MSRKSEIALPVLPVLTALREIINRVNDGWRYVLPSGKMNPRLIPKGMWFRFQDGEGNWVAPRPNGVQLESMTDLQQQVVYGRVVLEDE